MTPAEKITARTTATLIAALLLAGCGTSTVLGPQVTGTWSSAGLTYDGATGIFRGMTETPSYLVPTSGSARFSGEYRYSTATLSQAKGAAQLDINFLSTNVALTVSGAVNGTSTGWLAGGFIYGDNTSFPFTGQLYGTGATVAAGTFGAVGNTLGAGQFIVKR